MIFTRKLSLNAYFPFGSVAALTEWWRTCLSDKAFILIKRRIIRRDLSLFPSPRCLLCRLGNFFRIHQSILLACPTDNNGQDDLPGIGYVHISGKVESNYIDSVIIQPLFQEVFEYLLCFLQILWGSASNTDLYESAEFISPKFPHIRYLLTSA